jgi:hypothetical protein
MCSAILFLPFVDGRWNFPRIRLNLELIIDNSIRFNLSVKVPAYSEILEVFGALGYAVLPRFTLTFVNFFAEVAAAEHALSNTLFIAALKFEV